MEDETTRFLDYSQWPNFTREELACRHCGEIYFWPDFMDGLQSLRDAIGRPLNILSGHRCSLHNAYIGGAPLSEHLRLAVDVDLNGHNRFILAEQAKQAGFTGFGFYTTFIHLDMGRPRHWYGGEKARAIWQAF
ncbi:peptidase M15-like protein [Litorimonas taeanensis]|uniref:Peptidase M15-like protein n=1 Tax=Litorimonas taeanensis TaxID=568099 RepID=A0A420WK58_9PROT|nr:D-Ala-D-Ala carboxypeptidase family metallohydrolase [Litorimonas taeanensis]RKQ71326.1 peptidase M15-like protein [Litorimonas taeanensis]